MFVFALVCLLCMLAIPPVVGYFAGSALLGPLGWAVQTLRLRGRAQRYLAAPGRTPPLAPSTDAEVKRRLDRTALARRSLVASYFEGQQGEQIVLLRTQPRAVDRLGQPTSAPLGREQRKESSYVSASWLLVDLTGHIPERLQLHVQWMPDENVLGDEGLAAALIDGALHASLRIGDQLVIADGQIGVDSPFALREGRLTRLVSELARTATRLAAASTDGRVDVPRLLRETTSAKTSPSRRAKAVEAFLTRYPDHEDADEVREAALADPSAEVRFAAARHAGQDGLAVTEAVVFEASAAEGLRQRALRHLLRRQRREDFLRVLERVVTEGPDRLSQIAVRHAGNIRAKEALPWLIEAAHSEDSQSLLDVAEAMRRIEDPQAEGPLVALLGRPEVALQTAVADALGVLGSLTAIPALGAVCERIGAPRDVKLAAQGAIHAIRSRSTRTGAGALSITDGHVSGGLSVADAGLGAVSVPEQD